ncbi:MAG TPA: PQQ-binding-like beta-propeller repeat protein [Thermoanaerobaculia bacterium]|nr:PQQ-binding-like beta-propeller repeat protein [Thermoanaerobaculia bacterium]
MRRFFILTIIVIHAATAFAVVPQFWRVGAAEEFLAGESEGFAITSRGELRVAPGMKKIASFTDPFVLAQAAASNGDRFFGTGNDGKVYRLRGEELKLLFTAPEPEIYAIAAANGTLYAGSSPNGKIYRVDPESGAHTVFFDPQQAYIWAIEALDGGDLAIGTGVDGKLFRVTPKGEGKVLYDAADTHIRSLAERRSGSILAGASGKGRIYEIARDGSARALYDSALSEISSIYVDANGVGWAAAVSNVLPSSAPAKREAPKGQQQQQQQQGAASGEQKKEGEATANVEVSFSFEDTSAAAAAQGGSAEVYRINPDDFVETVRKFEREMVYAISGASDGGVLLATGPNGRVYQLADGELALLGAVPEKQVVSVSTSGKSTLITTTNSGAVYRVESGLASNAEFRSAAKDVERFSRFGHYRVLGRNLAAGSFAMSFRSGNTRTPDTTWSNWSAAQSALEGNVSAPPARYVQWKLTVAKPTAGIAIDEVTLAFINRNIAPKIEAIVVQDPAVVFISGAYPGSPQVVEVTNPDEYGIFVSLDNPRDRAQPEQGKRVFRKGFRTVSWRATDENGDSLRYTLSFRAKGTERWLRLRENIEESQINFDTSQLPDGRYELRLSASDVADNAEMPMTDVKDGIEFLVDNRAPSVAVTSRGDDVIIRITDELSPIGRVEYSADAQKWIRLTPADGIADSRDETFTLKRSAVEGKFVIVRAVDGYYNVATESVKLK